MLNTRFTATTTLAEFGQWYMFEHLPPPRFKGWQKNRRHRLKTAIEPFRNFLGREPVVIDLTKEIIVGFLATVTRRHRCIIDVLRALRHQAINMGILPCRPGLSLLGRVDGRSRNGGVR